MNLSSYMKRLLSLFISCTIIISSLAAQRVIYSEPNKDDLRQTNFEIIGRYGSNILVYKNLRNKNVISVYDADMGETSRLSLEYLN